MAAGREYFNAKAQGREERRIRRRKTLFEGMREEEDGSYLIDVFGSGIFGLRRLAAAFNRAARRIGRSG